MVTMEMKVFQKQPGVAGEGKIIIDQSQLSFDHVTCCGRSMLRRSNSEQTERRRPKHNGSFVLHSDDQINISRIYTFSVDLN